MQGLAYASATPEQVPYEISSWRFLTLLKLHGGAHQERNPFHLDHRTWRERYARGNVMPFASAEQSLGQRQHPRSLLSSSLGRSQLMRFFGTKTQRVLNLKHSPLRKSSDCMSQNLVYPITRFFLPGCNSQKNNHKFFHLSSLMLLTAALFAWLLALSNL